MNSDIAAEAAHDLNDWLFRHGIIGVMDIDLELEFKERFQAAIEKAYCAGVDAMTQAGIEAVNESRAAHASEPFHERLNEIVEQRQGKPAHASETGKP